MTTLVIAEHDNATLKGATLNTITAATQVGGDVHVLVAGSNAGAVATAAAAVAGVSKVLHADSAALAEGLAENVAAQVLAVASAYSHLFFPATASGKNVAPRVAAKLDVGQLSDISKVISADTFERPIYAGNAIATVQCAQPVKVATVRTTGFDPAAATGGSAAIEKIDAVADSGKSTFVGKEIAKLDRPELTAAKIIVSGGRAMGSSEKFNEVLTPLADKLGAALGASRAAVDAGYAPNDWQVGQTGKIVAPQLYVACGISGAIQHLAGMKDSKVIVSGFFAYHAVPTNIRALAAFRFHVTDLWRRTLRRRSQKDGMTWARMTKLAADWLPPARILHPWPSDRFGVKHPRWEPNA